MKYITQLSFCAFHCLVGYCNIASPRPGTVLWEKSIDLGINAPGALHHDGSVIIARYDNILWISPTTGEFLHQLRLPDEAAALTSPVVTEDGRIIVAGSDSQSGFIACIDGDSRELLWITREKPRIPFDRLALGPNNLIIANRSGLTDGYIYGLLSADGSIQWAVPLRNDESTFNNNLLGVSTSGNVIIPDWPHGVRALGAVTGDLQWQSSETSIKAGGLSFIGSHVFTTAGALPWALSLTCLSADTGETQWSIPSPVPLDGASVVVDGEHVICGSTAGLICFNVDSRQIEWTRDLGRRAYDPGIVTSDGILYTAVDGTIFGFNAANGEIVWQLNRRGFTPHAFGGSLILTDTGILVGLSPHGDIVGIETGGSRLAASGWPCSAGDQRKSRFAGYSLPSHSISIQEQPKDIKTLPGAQVQLVIRALGDFPRQYQWFKDGIPIEGRTNSTLRIERVQEADGGLYRVNAANNKGSLFSDTARLVVIPLLISVVPVQDNNSLIQVKIGVTSVASARLTLQTSDDMVRWNDIIVVDVVANKESTLYVPVEQQAHAFLRVVKQ